ncbi:PREDICTED: putative Myb family transcription factor At1g14600 [Camelina sativa]|uniref:Myb family transcription factor At1g14600 n=1 Tax=Camelina sativa TaxID=90675 RepID=A0ABM0TWP9_CAMSA|nr:PREDICTED: putative Myb family transcription factor At1g14600 [Camelina sativa]
MRDSVVRSYIRSETPRTKWTEDRHNLFVHIVEYLGGEMTATPKKILDNMNVRDLTISQVKSHLQMYRINKKEEDSIKERRMIRQINRRHSQKYLKISEHVRDAIQNQQRLQLDSTEKVTPMEVSCKSLYQSSRVGPNENIDNDVNVDGDGANGEEDMSLELTLGLKY